MVLGIGLIAKKSLSVELYCNYFQGIWRGGEGGDSGGQLEGEERYALQGRREQGRQRRRGGQASRQLVLQLTGICAVGHGRRRRRPRRQQRWRERFFGRLDDAPPLLPRLPRGRARLPDQQVRREPAHRQLVLRPRQLVHRRREGQRLDDLDRIIEILLTLIAQFT